MFAMTHEHGNNYCFYKLIYDENARKSFVSWALPVPCSPCVLPSSHGLQSLTFNDASMQESLGHAPGWGVTRTSLLLQETTKGVPEGRTWVSLAMGMLRNIRPAAPLVAIVTPRNNCGAAGSEER